MGRIKCVPNISLFFIFLFLFVFLMLCCPSFYAWSVLMYICGFYIRTWKFEPREKCYWNFWKLTFVGILFNQNKLKTLVVFRQHIAKSRDYTSLNNELLRCWSDKKKVMFWNILWTPAWFKDVFQVSFPLTCIIDWSLCQGWYHLNAVLLINMKGRAWSSKCLTDRNLLTLCFWKTTSIIIFFFFLFGEDPIVFIPVLL